MYILALKTDQADSTVWIIERKNEQFIYHKTWTSAHDLEVQLLDEIELGLSKAKIDYQKLSAVMVFSGPGSFTGLRIGFSVANTLGASLDIPVIKFSSEVPKSSDFENISSDFDGIKLPDYGRPANITKPRK